jgi:hypothetical protein
MGQVQLINEIHSAYPNVGIEEIMRAVEAASPEYNDKPELARDRLKGMMSQLNRNVSRTMLF